MKDSNSMPDARTEDMKGFEKWIATQRDGMTVEDVWLAALSWERSQHTATDEDPGPTDTERSQPVGEVQTEEGFRCSSCGTLRTFGGK